MCKKDPWFQQRPKKKSRDAKIYHTILLRPPLFDRGVRRSKNDQAISLRTTRVQENEDRTMLAGEPKKSSSDPKKIRQFGWEKRSHDPGRVSQGRSQMIQKKKSYLLGRGVRSFALTFARTLFFIITRQVTSRGFLGRGLVGYCPFVTLVKSANASDLLIQKWFKDHRFS